MSYHIVTTLGPATAEADLWQQLVDAGATAFRLNTSHLSSAALDMWLEKLRRFNDQRIHPVPIILDLQGSKWRLGRFHTFTLVKDQRITLQLADASDDQSVLPVPHADFFQAADQAAGEIVLNDAKIRLAIESVRSVLLDCRVLLGGEISAHKGIALPGTAFRRESLLPKDHLIVQRCRGLANIRYALSYVKDGMEMANYRQQLGADSYLIAKLERQSVLDDSQAAASVSNEMWLCRGDLGAELGMEAMAQAVYEFHHRAREAATPIYMAGQVLEHMTDHPQPTRSEICHLYEVLQKGYSGLVLSDETAIGHYPLAACRTAALFQSGIG
jgi:pyruvate kinase